MALQILAVLAGTANFAAVMTPVQIYQFAVITTIYVPCVNYRRPEARAWNKGYGVSIVFFTIFLALGVGVLIRIFGPAFL